MEVSLIKAMNLPFTHLDTFTFSTKIRLQLLRRTPRLGRNEDDDDGDGDGDVRLCASPPSTNGKGHDAIELYYQMLKSGIMPDQFTFGSVVKACSGGGNVGLGRQLHAQIVKSEVGSHLIAQNALIAMYSKFDQTDDAWNVFSCIATRDLISWGSIIAGFSQLGYDREALFHFKEMLHHGEDIIMPLARLCCPLSLVVAQNLKTQGSYFLDELSMLYRPVFNPRNKSDKHHEKSD
ncbi:hypothetical protein Q3G72_005479 [Acer saccharum]|nr:hypothetical protein Q3G72_005479 [Acer saccharum]